MKWHTLYNYNCLHWADVDQEQTIDICVHSCLYQKKTLSGTVKTVSGGILGNKVCRNYFRKGNIDLARDIYFAFIHRAVLDVMRIVIIGIFNPAGSKCSKYYIE